MLKTHEFIGRFPIVTEAPPLSNEYCKSTKFDRYKIWRIDYFLSDNRGFSLYNPI